MFGWWSGPRARAWLGAVGLVVVGTLAMVTVDAVPARAFATIPIGTHPCADKKLGSLSVSAPSIGLGQSTTVSWNFHSTTECQPTWVRIYYQDATTGVRMNTDLSGKIVGPSGSASDRPQSSGSYVLEAYINGWMVDLDGAPVTVALPVVDGRPTVDITQPDQNGLFAQAIATEHALVRIAGTLDLDLSYMSFLYVAPGVDILGDRTAVRAGPRLFTTTFPLRLLQIGTPYAPSDHVHISGIRLDGGESDDPFSAVGQLPEFGITVFSSQDVELDHNEIARWREAAVSVHDDNDDPAFVSRINRDNADTVWVHDNYIHHNQHPSSNVCGGGAVGDGGGHAAGYGVEAADGAYVTIERNVFDWNRHSIAGDGKSGTGYIARDNLILPHGGVHFRCVTSSDDVIAIVLNPFAGAAYIAAKALDGDSIYHTHAIDMHAVNTCHNGVFVGDKPDFGDHNCGPAGEFMDIEFNTILYTAGNGIHLRGTPKDKMLVQHNVFAHQNRDGGSLSSGAILQNESGLQASDNLFGVNTFNDRKLCDFDGDGTSDPFIATGVTWWYASSVLDGRWVFLNRSPVRVADVTLGDVDGDGRCDMAAGGQVILNPDPQPFARSPGSISSLVGAPVTVNLSASGGTKPYSWAVSGLPPGLSATAAGQISGIPAANAASAYVVTATVTAANGQRSSVSFPWTIAVRVPNLVGLTQGAVPSALTPVGLHLGNVRLVYDCTDAPGTVLGQSPPAGQILAEGAAVDISVSSLTDGQGHHCKLN
jgi:hypothetical protein